MDERGNRIVLASTIRRAFRNLVGPRASATENAGTFGFAALGSLGAVVAARRAGATPAQTALDALIGADLVGGVWTNMTPSCKRWYHRPGQGPASLLAFTAVHVHPYVSARSHPLGWRYGAAHHGYVLAATVAVLAAPARLRPALAAVLALGGIALDVRLGPPAGREWMMPAYHLKLLPGHAVGPVDRLHTTKLDRVQILT